MVCACSHHGHNGKEQLVRDNWMEEALSSAFADSRKTVPSMDMDKKEVTTHELVVLVKITTYSSSKDFVSRKECFIL